MGSQINFKDIEKYEKEFGGRIYWLEPGGELCYEIDGKTLDLSHEDTETILEIMQQAHRENKNLLFEQFKDNIWKYDPNLVY